MNQIYSINDSRGDKEPPKKKFDFKGKKINTLKSLHEIEHFLCNIDKILDYIKLYNILK